MTFLKPVTNRLRRLAGQQSPALTDFASDKWEIYPSETVWQPPAIFLPDQLDRIRTTEFADLAATLKACRGNYDIKLQPTMGYRLRDVDLVDGVLYHRNAEMHLRPRKWRGPLMPARRETLSGAIYESWNGNRWFGMWLMDDCLTYQLAADAGVPVATRQPQPGNISQFESMLGMTPRRLDDAHFEELFLFDDLAPNRHKASRGVAMRQQLIGDLSPEPNPGVFLLRGAAGARRVLRNEMEIANRLERDRGFRIIDPLAATVDEIVAACAGARVVAGVEGSQLTNGVAVMPPGSTLLIIQPPDRMAVPLKIFTDRQSLRFAFVVASGSGGDYEADFDEIARTLDLLD
jgi:hypothetical protein